MLINESTDESFIDITPDKRLTDEEAFEIIKELSGIGDLNKFVKLLPDKQERLIKTMHEKGSSMRQLVRISDISKAKIKRILSWSKTREPSLYLLFGEDREEASQLFKRYMDEEEKANCQGSTGAYNKSKYLLLKDLLKLPLIR